MGCVREPSHCHGSPLHQVAGWELGSTSGVPRQPHGAHAQGEKRDQRGPLEEATQKEGREAKDVRAKTVEFVPLLSVLKGQLEMSTFELGTNRQRNRGNGGEKNKRRRQKPITMEGTERGRETGGEETGGRRGCERKRRKTGTGGGKESSASKFGTKTMRKGTN